MEAVKTFWKISILPEKKAKNLKGFKKFSWIAKGKKYEGYYEANTREAFVNCPSKILKDNMKTVIFALEQELRK